MKMFYRKPAAEWVEGLLQGNGRLGVVSLGGVEHERLALNEDTLWSGFPRDYVKQGSKEYYDKAAALVREGKKAEAERLLEEHLLGEFSENYEPLGDLLLDFPGLVGHEYSDYTRTLDLMSGVSETKFTVDGVGYSRTVFVSHPNQMICVNITADRPVLYGEIGFASLLKNSVRAKGCDLIMNTRCPSSSLPCYYDTSSEAVSYDEAPEKQGISAVTIAHIDTDGDLFVCGDRLKFNNTRRVELRIVCRSNFESFDKFPGLSKIDPEKLAAADLKATEGLSFKELLAAHTEDFTAMMSRQSIEVEGESHEELPTDERLHRLAGGGEDVSLPILLYQFGRYLLVSASRAGTQATNLQGIWNEKLQPPWSSNYTVNINTEMNYWPAEICNLPGVHEPLFDLLDKLSVTGAKTAKEIFGARGAAANHNTDLWGLSTPVGMHGKGSVVYGWWPMAYAWLSGHVFEHYIYTADKDFLRDRALPILRNAAQFFIDTVKPCDNGFLSFSPATSPENSYMLNGERLSVAETTTMADELIREVMTEYLAALELLGIDEPDSAEAKRVLNGLSPLRIGSDGRLLEWDKEYDEAELTHRHLSHLCGVFPGHLITEDSDKKILNAVCKSLEARGDAGTGWSLGWKVNLWARLRDGDHALKLLKMQLNPVAADVQLGQGGGSYESLLCAHPPFQIDGNFAAASGVPRLLADSTQDEITLLPALPSAWQNVKATGLSGANGHTIDIEVKNGRPVHINITAGSDRPTKLRLGSRSVMLTLKAGESVADPAELLN